MVYSIIHVTSSRLTQLSIVIGCEGFESRMSKFTSVPTTITLSVSDSLIIVIIFSVNELDIFTKSDELNFISAN